VYKFETGMNLQRSEVFTAVNVMIVLFWDMTPCSFIGIKVSKELLPLLSGQKCGLPILKMEIPGSIGIFIPNLPNYTVSHPGDRNRAYMITIKIM
jgi:hypothetical protein